MRFYYENAVSGKQAKDSSYSICSNKWTNAKDKSVNFTGGGTEIF